MIYDYFAFELILKEGDEVQKKIHEWLLIHDNFFF